MFFLELLGPYKVNGVPLRRVPQSYVLATKTKIDISKVSLSERLNDDFFKRLKKQKRSRESMFDESAEVILLFIPLKNSTRFDIYVYHS